LTPGFWAAALGFVLIAAAPAKADEVLPILDRLAKLRQQLQ